MFETPTRNRFLHSINTLLCASALTMGIGLSQPAQASEPFLGEIVMFAGNFAPRGWAFCDGQLLAINSNQALFSILGTTYGGDGRTTFALPDLRGRTAIGPRQGPGLSNYQLGQRGGLETVTLSAAQMPSHTHATTATLQATSTRGNSAVPTGNILASKPRTDIYSDAAPDVSMDSAAVTLQNAATGGSQAHENRMPYLAINHIIALFGIFPSRN